MYFLTNGWNKQSKKSHLHVAWSLKESFIQGAELFVRLFAPSLHFHAFSWLASLAATTTARAACRVVHS